MAARRPWARALSSATRYTTEHEYVEPAEGGRFRVGVTQYAVDELGDVVFVELPDEGAEFAKGDVVASIESVKAVGCLYAPADLVVVSANQELDANPSLVNEAPGPGAGGFVCEVTIPDPSQLEGMLTAEAYDAHVASLKD